ncbi:hypothetical protein [Massilia sp. CT11-137]|uniref:hypothetical protein n=1 Tax=Massilia sp. CT11-137 TaxID=3393901 RepID=UPI0039A542E1
MQEELSLRQVLAIEDTPGLEEFVCPDTGIVLWALIRSVFIRTIMSDRLYGTALESQSGHRGALGGASKVTKATRIARAFLHNAITPIGASPVVVMSSGARVAWHDDHYFNCLGEYFVDSAPQSTLLIEEMFKWRWPFPRQRRKILLHTPLRVTGALSGRRNAARYRPDSEALVELAFARAKTLLDYKATDAQKAWLVRLCSTAGGSLATRVDSYRRILTRAGAKLLVKEEACYGGPDNASAMIAARQLGIATAEYQHGSISAGHNVYNFGAALMESAAFRKTLPDYFLSYGPWWSSQVNAPVKHVSIGSPHRDTVVDAGKTAADSRNVLILGDGIETAHYLSMASALAKQLAGRLDVVFRPHPLERAAVIAAHPDYVAGAVMIDRNQDIYQSFKTSCAVVSEVSTGLFEAVGLVKSIFIWDTPKSRFAYPSHPFFRFQTVDQLAEAVIAGSGAMDAARNEQIWSACWRTRYRDFLAAVGAIQSHGGD